MISLCQAQGSAINSYRNAAGRRRRRRGAKPYALSGVWTPNLGSARRQERGSPLGAVRRQAQVLLGGNGGTDGLGACQSYYPSTCPKTTRPQSVSAATRSDQVELRGADWRGVSLWLASPAVLWIGD